MEYSKELEKNKTLALDTALEVSGVGRTFTDGTVALQDVSFSIRQGEFAVIAGSNGSGIP